MSKPPSELRVRLAVGAATLICLWGAVEHFAAENERWARTGDPYLVAAQSERLKGIAATLPANAVIGYITNLEPGSVAASAAFNTAVYALAPRLVVASTNADWVLGNFSSPRDYAAEGAQHGLEAVQDFGNGAVLYRRNKR